MTNINFPGSTKGLVPLEVVPVGDGNYAPLVARYAQTVSPVDQATTASFVTVTGSTLDTLYTQSVSYTILNDDAQSLTWQVLGANAADFSDAQVVQAPAAVLAAATSSYSAAQAVYRYYQVQVKDTVGGQHGAALVRGIAKG